MIKQLESDMPSHPGRGSISFFALLLRLWKEAGSS